MGVMKDLEELEFDTPSCEELNRRHKLLLTKAKKEYPEEVKDEEV